MSFRSSNARLYGGVGISHCQYDGLLTVPNLEQECTICGRCLKSPNDPTSSDGYGVVPYRSG